MVVLLTSSTGVPVAFSFSANCGGVGGKPGPCPSDSVLHASIKPLKDVKHLRDDGEHLYHATLKQNLAGIASSGLGTEGHGGTVEREIKGHEVDKHLYAFKQLDPSDVYEGAVKDSGRPSSDFALLRFKHPHHDNLAPKNNSDTAKPHHPEDPWQLDPEFGGVGSAVRAKGASVVPHHIEVMTKSGWKPILHLYPRPTTNSLVLKINCGGKGGKPGPCPDGLKTGTGVASHIPLLDKRSDLGLTGATVAAIGSATAKKVGAAVADTKGVRLLKEAHHAFSIGMAKTREVAVAAAAKRGMSEKGAARLNRCLAIADAVGTNATWAAGTAAGGVVAGGLGAFVAGKVAMAIPTASAIYLAYGAAKDRRATLEAAKEVVAKSSLDPRHVARGIKAAWLGKPAEGRGPTGNQVTHAPKGSASGGQFVSAGGAGAVAKSGKASPEEHAAAKKIAAGKVKIAPVPPLAKVVKMRAELQKCVDYDAKAGKLKAGGKTPAQIKAALGSAPRPGGDARGSSYSRRARAKSLFGEFGGEAKGYVVCHESGLKMHWSDDPKENPKGYPKFEQGKVFVAKQGGGYQMPNLLPESFAVNRGRNDKTVRKENLKVGPTFNYSLADLPALSYTK